MRPERPEAHPSRTTDGRSEPPDGPRRNPGPAAHGTGWHLHTSRHGRALDDNVERLQHELDPLHTMVVVRTAQQQILLRRRLRFPAQVLRLNEFLAAAGPHGIRPDDIVPDIVPTVTILDAVLARTRNTDPDGAEGTHAAKHGRRRALSGADKQRTNEVRRGLTWLSSHGRRLTPGHLAQAGEATPTLRALLDAQAATDDLRRRLLDDHHFLATDVVLHAAAGTPRLRVRFPTVRHLILHGIDTLSPAERAAIENVAPPDAADLAVHWHLMADPPTDRDGDATPHPGLRLTAPLARWVHERSQTKTDHREPNPDERDLTVLFHEGLHAPRPAPFLTWTRDHDAPDEAERVADHIVTLLESGIPAHHLAIAPPRLEDHAPVYQQRLAERGIPTATSAAGLTKDTPTGTLLRCLLDAARTNLRHDTVIDVLTHPAVDWRIPVTGPDDEVPTDERPDGHRIARRLAEHGLAPIGRTGWHRAMQRMWRRADVAFEEVANRSPRHHHEDPEPAGPPAWQTRQNLALEHVLGLLQAIRDAPDATTCLGAIRDAIDASGHLRGLRRILRTRPHDDRPRIGQQRVLALLDETETAFETLRTVAHPGPLDGTRTLETLEDLLRKDHLPPIGDPQEGVQLVDLRNLRGWHFDHVFIPDCRQETLPEPERHDPIGRLLERILDTRFERVDPLLESQRILHGILADTTTQVHLSCAETDDEQERVPSTLIDEILGAYETQAAPRIERLTTTRRQDIHAGRHGLTLPEPTPATTAAHTAIAERAHAQTAGRWTGLVTDADARERMTLLQPGHADHASGDPRDDTPLRALSASRLETYAACPARHMYRAAIGIEQPRQREDGLQPQDKGLLVHAILHHFIQDHLDAGHDHWNIEDDPDPEARMCDIATELIDHIQLDGMAWESFQVALLAGLPGDHGHAHKPKGILARFLDLERAEPRDVVATEVDFGRGEAPSVQIPTPAGPIPIRGSIDRIERRIDNGAPHIDIVDYKTGTPPKAKTIAGGVRLQLPLYLAASRTLHPEAIAGTGTYVQLRRPEKGEVHRARKPAFPGDLPDDTPTLLDTWLPRLLAELVRASAAGHGHTTLLRDDDAGCQHCDYRRICAVRPHLRHERIDAIERRWPPNMDGGAETDPTTATHDGPGQDGTAHYDTTDTDDAPYVPSLARADRPEEGTT